jgi:hypothetical protein
MGTQQDGKAKYDEFTGSSPDNALVIPPRALDQRLGRPNIRLGKNV